MKSRKFKPLSDGFLGKVEPNISTHAVDPTTLPGHSPVTPGETVFSTLTGPILCRTQIERSHLSPGRLKRRLRCLSIVCYIAEYQPLCQTSPTLSRIDRLSPWSPMFCSDGLNGRDNGDAPNEPGPSRVNHHFRHAAWLQSTGTRFPPVLLRKTAYHRATTPRGNNSAGSILGEQSLSCALQPSFRLPLRQLP